MTKELYKANMKRSRLRNKFLKDRVYSNLDIKKVTDNKTFWKAIILLFTKRPLKGEKINFIENGQNISNDTELCNIFNGFFSNIISELNTPKKYHCFLHDVNSYSVLSGLKAFENNPTLRIPKVKSLIRHFLLRILTLI